MTSWTRSRAPTLASRRATCALAVAVLMYRWAAISAFDMPRPTRVRTSRSRPVTPAALGVLNTVVMQTRERVHHLGVFKAIGMTSRQAIVMVTCWVAGTGLAAGALAVPAGIALHRHVLPVMFAALAETLHRGLAGNSYAVSARRVCVR